MKDLNNNLNKNSSILVIAGGISDEREISLRSGKGCLEALKNLGYKNTKFFDFQDLKSLVDYCTENIINYAFLCTHGNFGEDGKLQSVLEFLKIKYTGSNVLSSALCMNKIFTKQILKLNNINTSAWYSINNYLNNKLNNINNLKFPVMLKKAESGSSFGVFKIKNIQELDNLISQEIKTENSKKDWFIEDFQAGTEITVSLLEINKKLTVLPILELRPKKEFYDLEAKYTKGLTEFILPAEISPEQENIIKTMAINTFLALGCAGFARVDMIIPKTNPKEPVVLEVNTLPGMTETSDLPAQAENYGIKYKNLVELMLLSCV